MQDNKIDTSLKNFSPSERITKLEQEVQRVVLDIAEDIKQLHAEILAAHKKIEVLSAKIDGITTRMRISTRYKP